jgi:hypothetical protein
MTDNENNRRSLTQAPTAYRFPYCGTFSVAAPLLGYVALEIILPCFEGRNWNWRLFLDGGPTWLQGMAYTIMGFAGVVGLVLGCIALWRSENRAIAALGLLLNAPLICVLIIGLAELVPELPDLLDRSNRMPKGKPIRE